ncbi:MAG TPA: extracellular solute-binding protein [Ensifer sp.]|nr:extracellular solute-binding protein [Ensifer sp.]
MSGYLSRVLTAFAVAGALFAGNAQAQEFAGKTLKVATFGGSWQEWVKANVEPKFKAATGANVEYISGFPMKHLTSLISFKGQAAPFDVVELSDDVTYEALKQDLLQTGLDMALIPNAQYLPEPWRNMDNAGPAYFVVLQGVIYDADKFKAANIDAPKSWDDLANPALAGHVALPDVSFTYRPIYAAIDAEKTGDQANFKGSLDWVSSIKNPVIYGDAPTLQTRFGGGEIWAVVGAAGYLQRLSAKSPNLRFVMFPGPGKTQGIGALGQVRIVKNSPNAKLAHYWINTFLDTEVQVSLAQKIGFAPANINAAKTAAQDPKLAPLVMSDASGLEKLFQADWSKLNPVLPDWIDRWNRAVRR